ncbi:unnamed protein product [Soboliphyme baturini]|uniref:Sas10 domain-containing protein n=1 Tax=Soboliphyme baturini TaxID=241478 RepID=A0A183JAC1_9BILA|nr:unnamed protein product [Soboliphyme baturini]
MGVHQRYFRAKPAVEVVQNNEEVDQTKVPTVVEAFTSVEDRDALTETVEPEKSHKKFKKLRLAKRHDQLSEDELEYPIDSEKLQKYRRFKTVSTEGIKTVAAKKKFRRQQQNAVFASAQTARAELLLPEDSGYKYV